MPDDESALRSRWTALLGRLPARQLGIYLVVGVASLGVELSSFHLFRGGGLGLSGANILARSLGALLAFNGNRAFTFARPPDRRGQVRVEAFRYLLLFVFLTALSTALLHGATRLVGSAGAGWTETATKFGVDIVVVITGFISQRLWVFRPTG